MFRLIAVLMLLWVAPALAQSSPPSPPPVAIVGGNASLAVTAASARVILPVDTTIYPAVLLLNDGAAELFWKAGDSSVVATAANFPLPPGDVIQVWLGNATNIAAITSSGTSTLRVIQANGAVLYAR
jgi:hypothetical protein